MRLESGRVGLVTRRIHERPVPGNPSVRLQPYFAAMSPAMDDKEIRQKQALFRQEMQALMAWDKATRPNGPVILSANVDSLEKRIGKALLRQRQAGIQIRPFVIGITGASASGKSFTKNLLMQIMPEEAAKLSQWSEARQGPLIDHVEFDHYYRPDLYEKRKALGDQRFFAEINLDEPAAFTMKAFQKGFRKLRKGNGILMPTYNFPDCKRTEHSQYKAPAPFMILEGLFPLLDQSFVKSGKPLYKLTDLRIFVEADEKTLAQRWWSRAPERGIKQDEGGQKLYDKAFAMYHTQIAPTRKQANLILNGAATKADIEATLRGLARILLQTCYPVQPLP